MAEHSIFVTPSILSCNLAKLQEEVQSIEREADWLQIDVMDGHFVPNLSFGAPVIKNLKTSLPLDIHLMVDNPLDRMRDFLPLGVKNITFHAEAVKAGAKRTDIIQEIHAAGVMAGIALKPETPISAIEDVLPVIDLVLIMAIEPGFAGQTFMPEVLPKIKDLASHYPDLMIQVDGGIDEQTAKLCREAGAKNLVSASYIFSAPDRLAAIRSLRGS
jgi:ribulose-phosphate 3-epimerase